MSDGLSGLGIKTGSFPVLDSSNFVEWLDLVETVLLSRGLWDFASGDTKRPSESDKAKEFEKEDAKATAFLKMAAGKEQRAHLLGMTSSKAVLDKLRAVHQVSQQERVQRLLSQFHTFKARDNIDLSASRLTQLQLEIAAADPAEKPSDTVKKTVLLHSLPGEYQSTVFALKAAGLSKTSFDDVVQRLKEVEGALKDHENPATDGNLARVVRRNEASDQRAQNDRPRKKDRSKVECYHCHKKGHYRSECWSLQGESRQQPAEHSNAAWGAKYQSTFAHQVGHGTPERQEWVLDSGCTRHMTFDRGHFIDFETHAGTVTMADGKTLRVQGGGTIEVPIHGKMTQITGVIYVPAIGFNLLSVSQLGEKGMACNFTASSATLSRNGCRVATAVKKGMTYVLKAQANDIATPVSDRADGTIAALWHQRLGHPGERKLELFLSGALEGMPQGLEHVDCETCKITKSTHVINRSPVPRAIQLLERAHMDFWGPYDRPTLGGRRYMLTITDDASRKSWIHLVRDRKEVYESFHDWRAKVELESGRKLKAVRIDNAPEFLKLSKELEKDGVRVEPTVAYTPSQNGVAERLNRTLITKARALLSAAELPVELWGEAVHTANYLKNRTPSETDEGPRSPEQMWTGRKPGLSHLRTFGCVAYAHVPAAKRAKLDQTALKGVFVGYAQTTRQYRILDPQDVTVKLHSDVRFDESQNGGRLLREQQMQGQQRMRELNFDVQLDLRRGDGYDRERGNRGPMQHAQSMDDAEGSDDDILSNIDVHQPHQAEEPNEIESSDEPERQPATAEQRPTRNKRLPQRYRENSNLVLGMNYTPTAEIPTPSNYEEAVQGKNSREWRLAIQDQLQSLEANHTWDIVDAPRDINLIDTKWVFKIKMLPNGQIDRYKARLCARGFTQEYGIDYLDTFSPVIRMESLRILLALAAVRDLEVHQMDVVSAYLLGELEDDAYLKPPKGLEVPPGKALKLKKGMPGLKQSGRIWNKTITAFFEKAGLRSIPADHSVFTNTSRSIIVAIYVDDLIILARTVAEMEPLKKALSEAFEMKDLGEAKYVLGVSIRRDRSQRTLAMDQEHYIRELVSASGPRLDHRASTPANGYANITKAESDEPLVDVCEYQTLVGKLNWLARTSRPDIAFVTQKLSQFAHKPSVRHLGGARNVLQYLAQTAHLTIKYCEEEPRGLAGYADADYAADETRRSTMGYIFTFAKGPITWSSKLQRSISTSTTEAEYHALAYAGKEAVWIRNLLDQLGYAECSTGPTSLYSDNEGALALVKNPEFHARTKHIDVSAHYIRELAEDKKIKTEYAPTHKMLADILTKPLKKVQHQKNVNQIGLSV